MFKSWRLGKLFGFPIELNLSFLILLGIVFLAFGGTGLLGGFMPVLLVCLVFGFVVLHELGHAFVARQLGVHIAGIELSFLGGAAKMMNLPRTPRHEILIAAAGPAVSLMLGGAFLGIGGALGWPFIEDLGKVNLLIAGFNLIPALPMDGGRILRALLVPRFGYVRATDLAVTVARVAAVGFVVLGLTAQLYMLLVLAPFLWLMGTRERMIARMTPDEGWYRGDGVEILGRDAWRERGRYGDDDGGPAGWGSPFDPRTRGAGGIRRFTLVRRNGRLEVVPLD
ncbi:MAG TPA: M50 family metallopeptidase [Kofleriaceae bacterium]|nr:M50 family metallopeptidase [Kofleriaceae bacterium]